MVDNLTLHLFQSCTYQRVLDCREHMWYDILDCYGPDTYVTLDTMDTELQTLALLGAHELDIDNQSFAIKVGHFLRLISPA